jgi:hypothetical protein
MINDISIIWEENKQVSAHSISKKNTKFLLMT